MDRWAGTGSELDRRGVAPHAQVAENIISRLSKASRNVILNEVKDLPIITNLQAGPVGRYLGFARYDSWGAVSRLEQDEVFILISIPWIMTMFKTSDALATSD
jgi:hypothetical protein